MQVDVAQVPFAELKGWHFDEGTGDLCHQSGKFFSIVGIDVYKNQDGIFRWKQPIINQPEVGYLGIICKEFDGVLYFLLQAKIEPGNVNCDFVTAKGFASASLTAFLIAGRLSAIAVTPLGT